MPAVVAQRMCDLLQMFPSAAIGGVQWQTLVARYVECHSSHLDLRALGHNSALSGATALLWDVLRVVESEDTDNPVVAIEDAVALMPHPGFLACWPSLYQSLCMIVKDHGTLVKQEEREGLSHEVLFSQLKPLLQKHWHRFFNESSLSYFTEEGSCIKLKKMKHLLQAMLRWREQRITWQAEVGHRASAVDVALQPRLELVPSKKHNDLLLRCFHPGEVGSIPAAFLAVGLQSNPDPRIKQDDEPAPQETQENCTVVQCPRSPSTSSSSSDCRSSTSSVGLAQELASLRAENAVLRHKNAFLQHRVNDAVLRAELFDTPSKSECMSLETEVYDDPFEPPPLVWTQSSWRRDSSSSLSSTAMPGSLGLSSGSLTPLSHTSRSQCESGSATPARSGGTGQVCAFVPVWFSFGDRLEIPQGVVQQARAVFERQNNRSIPSFFVQQ